jgi:hypothetical protein
MAMPARKNRPPSSVAPAMGGAGVRRSPESPRRLVMSSAKRKRAAAMRVEWSV